MFVGGTAARFPNPKGEGLEIHWHDAKFVDDDAKSDIEKRLHALADQGQGDLIDIRISGNPSRHKGHTENEVKITCEARGQEIVARCQGARLENALHDALDSLKKQVRDMRAKRKEHRASRGYSD